VGGGDRFGFDGQPGASQDGNGAEGVELAPARFRVDLVKVDDGVDLLGFRAVSGALWGKVGVEI
jgi:hypothetical protein